MCQTWPGRKRRLARGIVFLGGRFCGQKAISKLLNNAFYATLYCQIKKLSWSDPAFDPAIIPSGSPSKTESFRPHVFFILGEVYRPQAFDIFIFDLIHSSL